MLAEPFALDRRAFLAMAGAGALVPSAAERPAPNEDVHVGIGTDGGTTGIDDMAAFRAAMREQVAARRAAGIGPAGENPDALPFVEALSGPGQFRRLIGLLERRGYPARRIEKIMGLNFLDLAREVWG
jgi:membrane dipeptidase